MKGLVKSAFHALTMSFWFHEAEPWERGPTEQNAPCRGKQRVIGGGITDGDAREHSGLIGDGLIEKKYWTQNSDADSVDCWNLDTCWWI